MKYVTCVYNGLNNTEYGGALNRDNHYKYSLRYLDALDAPIICYISQIDYNNYIDYFKSNGTKNIEFRIFELDQYPDHDKILSIRNNNKEEYYNVGWKNRCVEIMWGKFLWLDMVSNECEPDEKIFWIDAGISHGGIIPTRFNPVLRQDPHASLEEKFNFSLAFNKLLTDWLDSQSNENVFVFETSQPQYPYPDLFINDKKFPTSIIAGLFGGKKSQLKFFIDEFNKIKNIVLDNNFLLREEQIMTVIFNQFREKFNVFKFHTWYHEDWDCYDGSPSFSDFIKEYIHV